MSGTTSKIKLNWTEWITSNTVLLVSSFCQDLSLFIPSFAAWCNSFLTSTSCLLISGVRLLGRLKRQNVNSTVQKAKKNKKKKPLRSNLAFVVVSWDFGCRSPIQSIQVRLYYIPYTCRCQWLGVSSLLLWKLLHCLLCKAAFHGLTRAVLILDIPKFSCNRKKNKKKKVGARKSQLLYPFGKSNYMDSRLNHHDETDEIKRFRCVTNLLFNSSGKYIVKHQQGQTRIPKNSTLVELL